VGIGQRLSDGVDGAGRRHQGKNLTDDKKMAWPVQQSNDRVGRGGNLDETLVANRLQETAFVGGDAALELGKLGGTIGYVRLHVNLKSLGIGLHIRKRQSKILGNSGDDGRQLNRRRDVV